MSPAWHLTLTMILGLAVAGLAAACLVLLQRLHVLSSMMERTARPEPVTIPIDPPPAPASPAPVVIVPARSRPAGPRAGVRVDPAEAVEAGPTLIAVPRLEITKPPAASDMDRRFADVWALADAGMPAATIAVQTGYPIGQVELILGLRRRLPAGTATHG